jgi:anti-sigma regulatory factor (Ser/Thr protein kinase)
MVTVQIRSIQDALGATVIEGADYLDGEVQHVYASDLMSDVLAFGKPQSILLTGLATQQAVISAHMAEFKGVVFIRGKRPKDASDRFSRDSHLVLLSSALDMYEACLRLGRPQPQTAVEPAGAEVSSKGGAILLQREFPVRGGDFAEAGVASTEVKSLLKTIGFDPKLVRRVAISTYEGEMNVVMHARKGVVNLTVTPEMVTVVIADEGKGIPDIDMAMQQGFTTATEEMRAMGFGSGMGLPNIKNNADELAIDSEVDKGTTLRMKFST